MVRAHASIHLHDCSTYREADPLTTTHAQALTRKAELVRSVPILEALRDGSCRVSGLVGAMSGAL